MINKNYTYAIIGASQNEDKYGYKVLKDLKEAGFKVIPINLKADNILGLKTYKSILDVNEKIDVAIFVVPPHVSEQMILEVDKANIKNVWLQPGAVNEKVLNYCKENDINCIHDACIMVKRKSNY